MFFISDATIQSIPDNSIDLVVTDPPFGIGFTGLKSNYNRKPTVMPYKELDNNVIKDVVYNINNVVKFSGSFWLIMGWNNLSIWETECKKYFNQIGHVIWKYQFGVYTKKRPVSSHYHLLVYTKNKKVWTWNQHGYDEDVWTINRTYKKNQIKYPNRLPDKLVEEIVSRSSNPGDSVYDPFCGSGTIPRVATSMGRLGIGSDIQNNNILWRTDGL